MMGTSHMLIGAAAGLGAAYLLQAPAPLELMAVATFTALLPDIDHPQGTLRRKIPLVDDLLLFWLPHRGITHTVLAVALVAVICNLLHTAGLLSVDLCVAAVFGYISHLVADLMTVSGLKVWWPLSDETYHLWPGLRTGGITESLVCLVVFVGIGWLLIQMNVIDVAQLQARAATLYNQFDPQQLGGVLSQLERWIP
ncbi:MAG: metal-dependent hydrolase [Anaerolineae bacterium]|nr:metal-dependent hydrolase [Anaerolineae bacterium]